MSDPKPSPFTSYKEASDHQLAEWVAGRPWHNPLSPNPEMEGGECCPDFSCCQPELLAPEDVRQRFVEADDKTRHEMLMMFLGAMINKATEGTNKRVHLAGDVHGETH